jgi:hypothetical protein
MGERRHRAIIAGEPGLLASRMPSASASRDRAVIVGFPGPFSRLAMKGTGRPALAAGYATAAARRDRNWLPIVE